MDLGPRLKKTGKTLTIVEVLLLIDLFALHRMGNLSMELWAKYSLISLAMFGVSLLLLFLLGRLQAKVDRRGG